MERKIFIKRKRIFFFEKRERKKYKNISKNRRNFFVIIHLNKQIRIDLFSWEFHRRRNCDENIRKFEK